MAEPSKKYVLDSVRIFSSRSTIPVEIADVVSDLDIFEHLDTPFLTAQIAFADESNLMSRLDLQGAEYVVIKIKPNVAAEPAIEKRFVIETVLSETKVNETSEMVILSLYEDILFKSNFKNVNKSYSGSPIQMIRDIAEEFLDKGVIQEGQSTFQNKMKLIVPNLDPLKAIAWIKNRMTTSDGVPDFIYSSLGVNKLIVNDLLTMIDKEPVNSFKPFMYASSPNVAEEERGGRSYLPITSYTEEQKENMFEMIQQGLVGAQYQFYDAFTSQVHKHDFNFKKDIIDKLPSTKEKTYNFAEYEIDGDVLNKIQSQRITQIGGSGAYNSGLSSPKSYNEEKESSDYAKKVIGNVMKQHLLKAPITIRVPGVGFMKPDYNMTIGNNLRIYFLKNRPADSRSTNNWDMKKSGDYLMYATKHSFTLERYDISITCAKMKNFTSENAIV